MNIGPTRWLRRSAWLLGALLIAGCAALAPHFERPQLSLMSIEMRDATLTEQRFRVRMRVQNPNSRALPVEGISYTIDLADEELGRGVTAEAFTVPAFGEAEFEMIVTTNLAASLLRVLPRLRDKEHPPQYRLVGKVNTSLPFLRSIPFDERGAFPTH